MRTHCITIDLANQGRRQVRARFDGGRMSSDGGALLLQAVDQRIGLTRRLFGLALRYEDLCDHDRGHPLAGSSTLNRLELGTPEQAPQDRYKRIVGQIRQRWPRVRGDAGFCRDELMAWCEAAEGVDYVFGLAQNARRPGGGVFTLRQFAEQDGQSAPEPVPVDADMATRGDS